MACRGHDIVYFLDGPLLKRLVCVGVFSGLLVNCPSALLFVVFRYLSVPWAHGS